MAQKSTHVYIYTSLSIKRELTRSAQILINLNQIKNWENHRFLKKFFHKLYIHFFYFSF